MVERCGAAVRSLAQSAHGPDVVLPDIRVSGHLDASFPYISSHLEYIVGELLRNSVQAVIEPQVLRQAAVGAAAASSPAAVPPQAPPPPPPPIEVTICEAPQQVIMRFSDQGGGIPRNVLPYLWSFSKGPDTDKRLRSLQQVPHLAATLQELRPETAKGHRVSSSAAAASTSAEPDAGQSASGKGWHASAAEREHSLKPERQHAKFSSSLSSLAGRPPDLRLGVGLPLSRVYAEYWAGSLELHSLEGYGVDAFLQISKLGNKNEQLTTRATMDAV